MDVEIRLLGPVGIWDGACHLGPSAGQQRTVLAVLALDCGHVVSMDRLVTALWGPAPPATARNVVQVCVSRLRTLLGPAATVRGAAHGYCLETDRQAIDTNQFRDLVRRAGRGEPSRARDLVESALRLWRGPALVDVVGPWLGEVVAPRLAEERFAALELRAGLDLALGRYGTVIDDLAGVVAESPTRERLVLALLTALHRDGRRPAALELFRRVRRQYVDELGIEPGADLQRAHQAILCGDSPDRAVAAGPVPPQRPVATSLSARRRRAARRCCPSCACWRPG
jgi:DNA-binding SARP family transcriptional activator